MTFKPLFEALLDAPEGGRGCPWELEARRGPDRALEPGPWSASSRALRQQGWRCSGPGSSVPSCLKAAMAAPRESALAALVTVRRSAALSGSQGRSGALSLRSALTAASAWMVRCPLWRRDRISPVPVSKAACTALSHVLVRSSFSHQRELSFKLFLTEGVRSHLDQRCSAITYGLVVR